MAPPKAPVTGPAVWGRPLALLALILLGPLLLLPTSLARVAVGWAGLLLLTCWTLGVLAFIGTLAGSEASILQGLERLLRRWAARFAPDPEALWIHWARQAHRSVQARWCLEQAAGLGGAEGLFQEGLAWFDGGFGAGGHIAGTERMAGAARKGHAEAAFWYADSLRTGRGCPRDPAGALLWYQRAASAGFGPAAAWLAQACAAGDGAPRDPDLARRWAQVSELLRPHPPLSRSPLSHDAAPEDPLVRAGAGVARHANALAERVVARRAGRWGLGVGAVLLAGLILGVVLAFFLAGASGLFFMPLLAILPPSLMLAWQAWQLRREGPRTGRDRLREAAEAGDADACYRLGLRYRNGTSQLPRDDAGAVSWFRRAAEAGHPDAMRALAEAYLGGHGVVRDPREAARWAEVASRGDLSRTT